MNCIHERESSIVTNILPKRNVWQDQAQTSQLRQCVAKTVSQFSSFKITAPCNKISHKVCIPEHIGLACS